MTVVNGAVLRSYEWPDCFHRRTSSSHLQLASVLRVKGRTQHRLIARSRCDARIWRPLVLLESIVARSLPRLEHIETCRVTVSLVVPALCIKSTNCHE